VNVNVAKNRNDP